MTLRGIRGATVCSKDDREAILTATRELLREVMRANPSLSVPDISSVVFTTTPDLSAAFPAQAARELGWDTVPTLCAREIPVPEALPRCIRLLIHWNTELSQVDVRHVYLGRAGQLRPDRAWDSREGSVQP